MKKLLTFLSLVAIVSLTSCAEIDNTQQSLDKPSVTSNQTEALNEQPKETPKDIVLKAGNYVIGTDIPVGVYDITALSGNGNVSTSDLSLLAMIGINTEYYEKEYKNIYLKKGVTIKVGGVEINLKYIRAKN